MSAAACDTAAPRGQGGCLSLHVDGCPRPGPQPLTLESLTALRGAEADHPRLARTPLTVFVMRRWRAVLYDPDRHPLSWVLSVYPWVPALAPLATVEVLTRWI